MRDLPDEDSRVTGVASSPVCPSTASLSREVGECSASGGLHWNLGSWERVKGYGQAWESCSGEGSLWT